ncbi:uncharacterized protein YfaS (alpha-2-macroglobulin family) [Parabacteroides sp. PF5-5]|uniref:alpha-2-macroglobulin family protein n=1 Tax=unclassified Parabacteroides TaxID=2649774 RepID=UPI002473BC26|nr:MULTISPECIES: MG2 domain-containing protein [unclassified Parabacteroides]MDH6303774.1 uncharacterized protein YfaS (alpha-2-macroglobulin family) [Parabacteroides sp. PH5-39]MDH6314391.1 uncharacterized protein YfaS (alpha-2-macroglobulin family) [Parabacteroides sp. PF5-13]MDH6318544.1 uncharacterized protein YfaS (alpha-2-macroglobulin family) [Parabacteroides sp. PH5-13]MDH6322163.1 uncharacterized protein YfaS (alpha-2-macroglobulin family) [Parabacteroides sp. PH5-8]MDH6325757.1 uncha
MFKPFHLLLAVCLFILLLSGCKSKSVDKEGLPFSPYVEAFTSGKVSRFSPAFLIFNEDLAAGKMENADVGKYMKIKPEVKGEFAFENNRTLVFRPAEALNRDTEYTITADMGYFFDAQGSDKLFTFKFTTLPLVIRANLESININPDNENGYDFVFTVSTPDRETPETIESLIKVSEKAELEWVHNADEKSHQLTIKNIVSDTDGGRILKLSVASNKLGVKEENIISSNVPAMNDFSIYELKFVKEPERYIEVTFTDPLDESQGLEGLAYIKGNQNETVQREDNKLRLFPDVKRVGAQTIFLSSSIKSKNGRTLGRDIEEEIEIIDALPDVKFTGEGTIIPQSQDLNVPFQAVYLRGVVVRVIKVLEKNMGQFLQYNSLGGTNELMRVGRLVMRKTIFLDEEGEGNLSEWKTYALKLNDLITPEPGAIYRIELSYNRDLSAYPCDDIVQKTKEQLLAEDAVKFKEESAKFDEGGYYYYYGDVDYDDYEYYDRENPCSTSYYYNKVRAKNILATNLGLMAMMGGNNEMTAIVHNLITTYPEKGVNVSLYNYQHQVIGSGITDDKGQVKMSLTQGRPYYMIASLDKQRSYMRIDPGSSLSLSSFDVSGEVVQKGIKGFIYGDRGVWRPGDTLFLSFMLNDKLKSIPANHPVTMELLNPLGQSYLRKTVTHNELGLYSFPMPTESDAPTGVWNATVQVGGVTFSKNIRIETIKPNRLKINLTIPEKPALRAESVRIPLHTEWLHGAVARNLKYDIQGVFTSTKTSFKNYVNFQFDDPAKVFSSEESKLIEGVTDNVGDASIDARFDVGNSAPGMLMASLTTRVFEESGEFSIDGSSILYSPYKRYVGIKSPQTDKTQLVTDKDHTFEVVSVDYEGKPSPTDLKIEVYKTSWYWWWNSSNEQLANYISDSYYSPREELEIKTDANGKGSFKLNMAYEEWGTYLIRVLDENGNHSTGIMSYFDWPDYGTLRNREAGSAPTMLSFKTDKETYTPGEKMQVTFPSPEGSRAIVNIENGSKVLAISEHLCQAGETTLQIEVTLEMQPNAYIYITLLQPYGNTTNDLPIRLYGVVPFNVNSPDSYLHPVISTSTAEFKPEEKYSVTVSEEKGRQMAYTLAIVDEGLLDLTRFPTPNPWKAFNAREALGVSTWDLYNSVLGAYGGRIEQLFSIGGDDALNKGPKAIVNRFKPVVQFEGPFLLKKGEKKRHTYTMPNYNGRVRVMVIAGDGSAYGHTEKSVMVRKPVMLLGTLPRVIGVGEEMAVPATVFATENNVGNVKVSITCSDNMEIIGSSTHDLNFSQIEDKQALFRIRVKDQAGAAKVTITASGKGEKSVYETDIEIRSVRRPLKKLQAFTLDAGKTWKESLSLPGVSGTNSLMLEMSDVPPLNLASRQQFLLGYPHGCLEQITSKAFPQLYLKEFASLSKKQEASVETAVKSVLQRYRSYQMAEGAFAYWPGGSSSNGWGTVYATHFMVEAGNRGYLVPDAIKRNALNYLKKSARNWKQVSNSYYYHSEEMIQAYRLYVLALATQPELGAMNRLKESTKLGNTSRWMLAAAYALVGREDVGNEIIASTTAQTDSYTSYDYTYGSTFRDMGIRLQTLSILKKGQEASALIRQISDILSSETWLSTQETAYALIGVSSYMSRYKTSDNLSFSYTCNGQSQSIGTNKNIWSETLFDTGNSTASLEVKNETKGTLFGRVVMEGIPEQGEETAYANGITLSVSYQDASGKTVDVSKLEQGTNFTAVVTVRNPSPQQIQNLVITEIFPAGWEILNTRFLHEDTQATTTDGISYQDIRDDRVYTYIDLLRSGKHVTVQINLTTAYAGSFYLPPVYCEAMYDNLTQANTVGRMVTVE